MRGESAGGLGLYVAGRAGPGTCVPPAEPADLRTDLKFTELVASLLSSLRHVRLLRSADGVLELMGRHREILAPKFALVDEILRDALTGIASWTLPDGGYFMTLAVPDGCASAVVRLAADAGIALTPAGATHPYGRDPRDRTIRLAPSFPSLTDLEQAMRGLATCVRLVAGG